MTTDEIASPVRSAAFDNGTIRVEANGDAGHRAATFIHVLDPENRYTESLTIRVEQEHTDVWLVTIGHDFKARIKR